MKKNHDYWHRRAIRLEREWHKRCQETVEKQLAHHYQAALYEIKNDILQLYATFAKDNGLDFNEAKQMLSSREFREWRMSVSEYLADNDAGLTRELNTLAMRPRINRLEKLYAETLQEPDKLGRDVSDDMRNFLSDVYKATESSIEDFWYLYTLRERIKEVYLEQGGSPHFYDPEHYFYSTKYEVEYNPKPNTIEAYWFAFNFGDGFDEVPDIEIEGKIDTEGSPFA